MEKVFSVFGGGGFIGSNVCNGTTFVPMSDKYAIASEYPDFVYAISTVHNYHIIDGDVTRDIDTNLLHLMKVLQANKIRYGNDFTVTFISSWFVYGKVDCPAKESHLCNPSGFYSITKLAAEQLLRSFCETFGIKYKIVRLSNILGAGDQKISERKNATQWLMREIIQGRDITRYDGDFIRDYIHVSDAADAIRQIAMSEYGYGEIYNVGSGTGYIVREVLETTKKLSGSDAEIKVKPVPDFHKIVQVPDMYLDMSKTRLTFGWYPKKDIYDIIEELIKEYK